jgi:hypothetical protein
MKDRINAAYLVGNLGSAGSVLSLGEEGKPECQGQKEREKETFELHDES